MRLREATGGALSNDLELRDGRSRQDYVVHDMILQMHELTFNWIDLAGAITHQQSWPGPTETCPNRMQNSRVPASVPCSTRSRMTSA
jgi:hypothetical protein